MSDLIPLLTAHETSKTENHTPTLRKKIPVTFYDGS